MRADARPRPAHDRAAGPRPADASRSTRSAAPGPQYVGRFAADLGVAAVVVPALASELSAYGAAASELRVSVARDVPPAPVADARRRGRRAAAASSRPRARDQMGGAFAPGERRHASSCGARSACATCASSTSSTSRSSGRLDRGDGRPRRSRRSSGTRYERLVGRGHVERRHADRGRARHGVDRIDRARRRAQRPPASRCDRRPRDRGRRGSAGRRGLPRARRGRALGAGRRRSTARRSSSSDADHRRRARRPARRPSTTSATSTSRLRSTGASDEHRAHRADVPLPTTRTSLADDESTRSCSRSCGTGCDTHQRRRGRDPHAGVGLADRRRGQRPQHGDHGGGRAGRRVRALRARAGGVDAPVRAPPARPSTRDNPGIAPATCSSPTTRTSARCTNPTSSSWPRSSTATALVAWCGSAIHQADVGGPVPGRHQLRRRIHLRRGHPDGAGEHRRAGRAAARHRARVPRPLAHARAQPARPAGQIAANRVTTDEHPASCATRYGTDAIVASLDRLLGAAEDEFRERLRALPDGCWRHTAYVEYRPRHLRRTSSSRCSRSGCAARRSAIGWCSTSARAIRRRRARSTRREPALDQLRDGGDAALLLRRSVVGARRCVAGARDPQHAGHDRARDVAGRRAR